MMRWRRWLFGILFILVVAGVYSARRSIMTSFLSSRFSARFESKSIETSLGESSVRIADARVDFGDGLRFRVDQAVAALEMRSLWKGNLIVNDLDLQGVRIPMRIPVSGSLHLPTLPDEFGAPPDVQAWIEPWLSDMDVLIDRESSRVRLTVQELSSRAQELRSVLDRTLLSQRSSLQDRKFAASMAREYHAIKQRMAELRIQARTHGKDHAKRWAQASDALTERFQARLSEMIPDADRQIQQLVRSYSQRISPMVLAYCDMVSAAMHPRATGQTPVSDTVIRRAFLTGELVDSGGSKMVVPFECQTCQWAWSSEDPLPTTALWNLELPEGKGRLEIQARRLIEGQDRSSGTDRILMDCYWYISPGEQVFEANPSRVSIQVQQSDFERTVSLRAPWDPRQAAGASEQMRLSPLAISFRQSLQRERRLESRTIPVAWESIAVEPRILFEMETALEQSKRQWLSQAHQQWNEIAASTIASKQEESSRRWQEISVETMEQLRQIDLQMVHWQELWDASTPHQQHRVGSKLPSHPDTYLSASR